MTKEKQLTETQLKTIASYCADWIYQYLISTTGIDRAEARRAAVNAANKAGHSIAQDLDIRYWRIDEDTGV